MSEQKVWVEKVPEVCEECSYIENFEGQCKLSGRIMTYNQMYRKVRKVSPLHSIKDHDRQLKQQLTEKQRTIDEINKEFVQAIHDWKTLCAEKDKEKTQLAIQELEKVKNKINNLFIYSWKGESEIGDELISSEEALRVIDQQIKELKELK